MFDAQCDLAAIVFDDHERPDEVLMQFCETLRRNGLRPVGLLQESRQDNQCGLSAILIHNGERIQIIPDSLPGASGCQLDVDQLLIAGSRIATAIDHGADLVVINRFGREECEGKGLRFLIEMAIDANIPVIIAVPANRFADWLAFSAGMSVKLACDFAAIDHWWQSVRRSSPSSDIPHIARAPCRLS